MTQWITFTVVMRNQIITLLSLAVHFLNADAQALQSAGAGAAEAIQQGDVYPINEGGSGAAEGAVEEVYSTETSEAQEDAGSGSETETQLSGGPTQLSGSGKAKSGHSPQRYGEAGLDEEASAEGGPTGERDTYAEGGPREIRPKATTTEAPSTTVQTTGSTSEPTTTTETDCSRDSISRLLGWGVLVIKYDSRHYNRKNGGPLSKEERLNCNFQSSCCWTNSQPPNDKLQFHYGDGVPDGQLFSKLFGTDELPEKTFALVSSPCAENAEAEAQLVSCTITCTDEPVKVTLRHWSSNDVQLRVCIRHAFFNGPISPLLHCVLLPKEESPGPSTVELPPGEVFDIVISASNFTDPLGDVAIVDDIQVEYVLCERSTLESANAAECAALECTFEQDGMCSYNSVSSDQIPDLTSTKQEKTEIFRVKYSRYVNYVTGVPKAAEGESYLGVYLKRNQVSMFNVQYTFKIARVITLLYYRAPEDVELYLCCSSQATGTVCQAVSEHFTVPAHEWTTVQFKCDAGTEEVAFICSTKSSRKAGTCAIDDIKLFVYDEKTYKSGQMIPSVHSVCP